MVSHGAACVEVARRLGRPYTIEVAMKMFRVLTGVCAGLTIAGCSLLDLTSMGYSGLIQSNYAASDVLVANSKGFLIDGVPVVVTTVVNIDELEQSSTLGRLIGEQVSARFAQTGIKVVEMKLQKAIYIKKGQGELMLTREIKDLAASHNAQAIVVGTYSRAATAVFVNLKIVQPESNIVIAAHDYSLPLNDNIKELLEQDNRKAARTGRY